MEQDVDLGTIVPLQRRREEVASSKHVVEVGLDTLSQGLSLEEVVVEGAVCQISNSTNGSSVHILGCQGVCTEEHPSLDLVAEAHSASVSINIGCAPSVTARRHFRALTWFLVQRGPQVRCIWTDHTGCHRIWPNSYWLPHSQSRSTH
jgi:hypothetical protein